MSKTGKPNQTILSRRAVLVASLQAVASLAACTAPLPGPFVVTAPPSPDDQGPRMTAVSPAAIPTPAGSCLARLPTIVPPTPVPNPGFAQLEPDTGLHVTGGAQRVDLASYRLQVNGLVNEPLSLSYDELRCLPRVEAKVRLECPGYFVDWAVLAGPTLVSLIALAGPRRGATTVTLASVGAYSATFSLEEVQREENFAAYTWRGEPLPASHGFPVRAVLPAKPGSAWVKWLAEIQLS